MKHRVGVRRRDIHPSQPQTCVCHPPSRCGPRCTEMSPRWHPSGNPFASSTSSCGLLHNSSPYWALHGSSSEPRRIVSQTKDEDIFSPTFQISTWALSSRSFLPVATLFRSEGLPSPTDVFHTFRYKCDTVDGRSSPLPTSSFISPATIRK